MSQPDTAVRVTRVVVLVREGETQTVAPHIVQNPIDMPLHPDCVPHAVAAGVALAGKFARPWNITGREREIVYASGPRRAARATLELMFTRLGIDPLKREYRRHAELDGVGANAQAHASRTRRQGSRAALAAQNPHEALSQAMPVVNGLIRSTPAIVQPLGLLTVTVIVGNGQLLESVWQVLTEGRYDQAANLFVLRPGTPVFLVLDHGHRLFRTL